MKAYRVSAGSDELLDPGSAAWSKAETVTMAMQTPPIGNVPSNYFRAMDPLTIGVVKSLAVASLHNGEALFFRLQWDDPSQDVGLPGPGRFRDGAGVLFPFGDTAPINNMGSKKNPVNAWCWQAGRDQPLNVTAAGLGTTKREEKSYCLVPKPVYDSGAWRLVIARPFSVPESELNVALSPGIKKAVGFAIWEGGNKERAGAKSFCGNWHEVDIEG